MGWKKLVFGEKMPDKNDPKYRERYEKEVGFGRKVARFLGIDKAAAATQSFANRWPKVFLCDSCVRYCDIMFLPECMALVSGGSQCQRLSDCRRATGEAVLKQETITINET